MCMRVHAQACPRSGMPARACTRAKAYAQTSHDGAHLDSAYWFQCMTVSISLRGRVVGMDEATHITIGCLTTFLALCLPVFDSGCLQGAAQFTKPQTEHLLVWPTVTVSASAGLWTISRGWTEHVIARFISHSLGQASFALNLPELDSGCLPGTGMSP